TDCREALARRHDCARGLRRLARTIKQTAGRQAQETGREGRLSKSIAAAKRAARIAVISAKCSSTKGRYCTELCGLPSICRWLRGPFSPLLFQKFHGIGRSPLDGSAFAPMMTPVSRWVPP